MIYRVSFINNYTEKNRKAYSIAFKRDLDSFYYIDLEGTFYTFNLSDIMRVAPYFSLELLHE